MMALMVASFIAPMASLLMEPVASSLINAIPGKRVMRAKKVGILISNNCLL